MHAAADAASIHMADTAAAGVHTLPCLNAGAMSLSILHLTLQLPGCQAALFAHSLAFLSASVVLCDMMRSDTGRICVPGGLLQLSGTVRPITWFCLPVNM